MNDEVGATLAALVLAASFSFGVFMGKDCNDEKQLYQENGQIVGTYFGGPQADTFREFEGVVLPGGHDFGHWLDDGERFRGLFDFFDGFTRKRVRVTIEVLDER